MRTTIKTLTALIFLTICTSSCEKDQDIAPVVEEVMKLPTSMTYLSASGSSSDYKFEYDNQNRLTKIKVEDDYFEYTYSGENLIALNAYKHSTGSLKQIFDLSYRNDFLDEIQYGWSPDKFFAANYNSNTQTYNLADASYDLDFSFEGENLVSFDHFLGVEITMNPTEQKNMFYAVNMQDEHLLVTNLTIVGFATTFLNHNFYEELYVDGNRYTQTADFDEDGYPTVIRREEVSTGDVDRMVISY